MILKFVLENLEMPHYTETEIEMAPAYRKFDVNATFTREEMKFLTLDGGLESNNQAVIRMTGGVPLKPHDSSIKRHLSRSWNGKNGNSGENACSPAQKKPSGQTARA